MWASPESWVSPGGSPPGPLALALTLSFSAVLSGGHSCSQVCVTSNHLPSPRGVKGAQNQRVRAKALKSRGLATLDF